ncbi:hypothetical protein MMC17_000114 [Xylographa soralifera]|nr:hypothetical protein [Xylographa soralifera]
MEIIEPLPLFIPEGVVFNDEFTTLGPKTIVVMVHGIQGEESTDYVQWNDDWLSSRDDPITHSFSPSKIVGEDSSEKSLETESRKLLERLDYYRGGFFALCGHDIGGTVVKLALVIAAQEQKYRYILEATHLVVFFGTPHRNSRTYTLDSAILGVIETCYNGLLGDWVPRFVNRLSRQHEEIGEEFRHISHQFGVLSYYEMPSLSRPCPEVVPKECATLGLDNETRIGRYQTHQDLCKFFTRQEANILQTLILNTKIANWDKYMHFMGILSLGQPEHEPDRQKGPRQSATHVFDDSKITNWISSQETSPRIMKIKLGDGTDPAPLLYSVANTIRECPESRWVTCPEVGTACTEEHIDETWIYTCLIHQILTQQPQSYLHMQFLVPIIEDSIRSNVKSWKGRTLWLCLRTLVHAPIGAPIYVFIHIESSASIDVLRRVHLAVRGTESMFRLVLAINKALPLEPLENSG